MRVQSPINISGYSQFTVGAGAQSAPLEKGIYDVWADADSYIKVGETATDVTTGTGYKIPGASGIVPVLIQKDGLRIGATAAISVHKVSD